MSVQALTDAIAEVTNIPKTNARDGVDAVFDYIARQIDAGIEVRIQGFGTFSVAKRAATTGRNPRTGEKIEIAAKRVVRFKEATALKDRLNTQEAAPRRRA